ncbi:hypothetical protein ACVWYH_007921 [Bradyrhizobium sp. GM24.11]
MREDVLVAFILFLSQVKTVIFKFPPKRSSRAQDDPMTSLNHIEPDVA